MILVEDDYVFLPPSFDSALIDFLESHELDYACAWFQDQHASHACGILRTPLCTRSAPAFWARAGMVDLPEDQRLFSRAILAAGGRIGDWRAQYRAGFWGHYEVRWYGAPEGAPVMVYPLQALHPELLQ